MTINAESNYNIHTLKTKKKIKTHTRTHAHTHRLLFREFNKTRSNTQFKLQQTEICCETDGEQQL